MFHDLKEQRKEVPANSNANSIREAGNDVPKVWREPRWYLIPFERHPYIESRSILDDSPTLWFGSLLFKSRVQVKLRTNESSNGTILNSEIAYAIFHSTTSHPVR